ncbi:chromatin modification-related protein YNG2 [Nadsonia fulvescens var. elongata DSM 6958]|uniref:Chromatin modification-related protein n=1 Tax=Nadsonia fulvescens var. elongata DSM 6958 TaxID=857566 RepID=A0A1E3PG82_9ASCO|nr:chromatin modification-related protein YNG2 [Nadsonia fulvescens var. elongata DSM 6958]
MDTASVLDQYVQDLSNIPNEIAHILEEIRDKDLKFYETRKRIQQRDNQIHKFIRTHGSLRPNPKEAQAYPKIRADFEKAIQLQDEKCELASTSLYLVAKHYKRLQKEIEKLENTGLLAPADEFADALATRLLLPTSRGTGTATPPHSGLTSSTGSSAHQTNNISGISYPGATSHVKRPAPTTATIATAASRKDSSLMGDEDEIYCFCRQVSFGDMIGCDNENCKYEWFHYGCVGLKEPPQGIWYCPACTKTTKEKETKKERKKK